MKILFLAPQPFFEIRGTPINVRLFVKALSDLGHEVDLLVYPHGDDVHIPNVTIKRVSKIPGVGKAPIGPSFAKIVYDAVMLIQAFYMRLRKKYDVVHAVEESVFIACLIKTVFGTPFVFDMDSHMSDQLSYSKFMKSKLLLRIFEKMETGTMKRASKVITVCPYLTDIARKHVDESKIAQIEDIPMQIDLPPAGLPGDVLRKRIGISNGDHVVLYTGNLEKYQGIDLVMDAAEHVIEEMPSTKFVVVGGSGADYIKYGTMAKSRGLKENMIFTGPQPMEWMSVFMQISDVLLSPRLEGTNTPLKIYTYLDSGKPLVATDLPTHTQLLTPEVAILAKPEKMEYASAILLLLKDEKLREKIGAAGRDLVVNNYNYRTFKDKVAKAYGSIC